MVNINKTRKEADIEEYKKELQKAFYHFNPKEIKKATKKGKTFIEKEANPITDELAVPITTYKVYQIMNSLLEHFYNEKMRIRYIKQGLKEFNKKRKSMIKKVHNSQINSLPKLPLDFIEAYMKKKKNFIKREYLGKEKKDSAPTNF